jgi:hypothetical protein
MAESSKAASQLAKLGKALVREKQLENWQKSLAEEQAKLGRQMEHAARELEQVREVLDADPELTAVAKEMMSAAAEQTIGADGGGPIQNPRYVSAASKKRLLEKILADFRLENPTSDSMGFGAIKEVLQTRYGVHTASAGLFFRNELKSYATRGGTKNRSVILDAKSKKKVGE